MLETDHGGQDSAEYPLRAYDAPARIARDEALHHVWGDDRANTTLDEIYISTDTISQVIFSLPPGHRFTDSELNGTTYPSDQIYFVLSGVFVVTSPDTQEVVCAEPGEAVYFGPDTRHHGYNWGAERAAVLEFSAPSARAAVRYAAEQPSPPDQSDFGTEVARWPLSGPVTHEARPAGKLWHLRPTDRLWIVKGKERHTVVGVLAATERLTAAEVRLPPGHQTEPERHRGEESGYLISGSLVVHVSHDGQEKWLELDAGDGYYLPAETRHRYLNVTSDPAVLLWQVVPGEPVNRGP